MNTVAATHEHYRFGRSEHVFPTNGAVTLRRALDAAMGVFY